MIERREDDSEERSGANCGEESAGQAGPGERGARAPSPPPGTEQRAPAPGRKDAAPAEPDPSERVEEDFDALLAESQRERDQYLDLAKRTKADFENYRKRMAAEVQTAAARGKAELAVRLIGVLDNLERALAAASIDPGAEQPPEEPLAQGFLLTYRELCSALASTGVQAYDPAGEKFDPAWHEALSMQPAEGGGPGVVVEVVQKGYRLGEQLIRPARVVVSE